MVQGGKIQNTNKCGILTNVAFCFNSVYILQCVWCLCVVLSGCYNKQQSWHGGWRTVERLMGRPRDLSVWAQGGRAPNVLLRAHPSQMYLYKVQMYLSKFQNVFVQIAKCICLSCNIYLSKFQNVWASGPNVLLHAHPPKCTCPKCQIKKLNLIPRNEFESSFVRLFFSRCSTAEMNRLL